MRPPCHARQCQDSAASAASSASAGEGGTTSPRWQVKSYQRLKLVVTVSEFRRSRHYLRDSGVAFLSIEFHCTCCGMTCPSFTGYRKIVPPVRPLMTTLLPAGNRRTTVGSVGTALAATEDFTSTSTSVVACLSGWIKALRPGTHSGPRQPQLLACGPHQRSSYNPSAGQCCMPAQRDSFRNYRPARNRHMHSDCDVAGGYTN